ncbi:copper homeostasis protein CutC [Dendryphion nanum]|uniref:Copper homeostasis protein cutC homolog n=1 Tax=Dendryphion nanum TaxID=256645 RepID=A0A9P9IGJ1_9PLEO|nr:copper homeostasis protein CutC [Dendryphion nanum]
MLEIACFNINSAINAAKSGADRIELCANYADGGVTPSYDTLKRLREQIETGVPINVMIRPRGGNFTYSPEELGTMEESIKLFKPLASGFVFGILDSEHRVDKAKNLHLVKVAEPLPCTFHRAFDQLQDMFEETEKLINCGFRAVLTSGGPSGAILGAQKVGQLQEVFDSKITFILGGGVRSQNIQDLKQKSKVKWFHSAAITSSSDETADLEEVSKLKSMLQNDD